MSATLGATPRAGGRSERAAAARRDLRAGDADRERTMEALREHTGAGRLSVEELDSRIGRAASATTFGELDAVVADLPRITLAVDVRERRARERRELRDHVRTYLAVNALLIVIWALTGADGAWFVWPLLGWGIGIAAHAIPVLGGGGGGHGFGHGHGLGHGGHKRGSDTALAR